MAKNKKPKFLEKETPDLLAMLKDTLSAEDEADIKKALKITDELISRLPAEEGPISVDEALQAAASSMTDALNLVKAAYDNEVVMMEDSDEEDEEEEEEEEEEKSSKKGRGSKKSKASEEEDEEDEEEDSDDEDDEDYSDWSLKDLKKECRTRGIKVTKGMAKSDMVKALEADDEE